MRAFNGCFKIILVLVRLQRPIGTVDIVFRGQNGVVSGQDGLNLPEYAGFGRARRAEQQQRAQAVLINDRLNLRMAQQRGQRRAEHNAALGVGNEQRLYAQPVTAERQSALVCLPQRKGINPVKTGERVGAPFEKCMQHDLGIGVPAKGVPA